MSDLSLEEFAALRATIRERGTARPWIFVASIAVWAALTLAMVLAGSAPVFTLVPLVPLAAGFEAIFHLHVGVERVGRYLQAFTEEPRTEASPQWETSAMEFGRGGNVALSDPLFSIVFLTAAFLNLLPALGESAIPAELLTIGGAHLVFAGRVVLARRAAASQRQTDLERFRALRDRSGAA